MIVRKEEYKVDEAAFLLDIPARTLIALCDAGLVSCSRMVANGTLHQRRRRYISHCEIVRFNATRPADRRANLAARLSDPNTEQATLPFTAEPDAPEPDGQVAVWVSKVEWRMVVAAVNSLKAKNDALAVVADKIGPAGINVIAQGLRVRNHEDIAA